MRGLAQVHECSHSETWASKHFCDLAKHNRIPHYRIDSPVLLDPNEIKESFTFLPVTIVMPGFTLPFGARAARSYLQPPSILALLNKLTLPFATVSPSARNDSKTKASQASRSPLVDNMTLPALIVRKSGLGFSMDSAQG